jgi:hypothetical protein
MKSYRNPKPEEAGHPSGMAAAARDNGNAS